MGSVTARTHCSHPASGVSSCCSWPSPHTRHRPCSVSKQTCGIIHLPCGYLGAGVLSSAVTCTPGKVSREAICGVRDPAQGPVGHCGWPCVHSAEESQGPSPLVSVAPGPGWLPPASLSGSHVPAAGHLIDWRWVLVARRLSFSSSARPGRSGWGAASWSLLTDLRTVSCLAIRRKVAHGLCPRPVAVWPGL